MRAQRLRVTFAKGAPLRHITHLDLMRFWERALRRAEIPLAYSEGFSPHPQISLASPLPVGVIGSGELMDIFLSRRIAPRTFLRSLSAQLPPGLTLAKIREQPLGAPSIQSQMRAAEYRVELATHTDCTGLKRDIACLLAEEHIPWTHTREKDVRTYDLRPLVQSLELSCAPPAPALRMRLRADNAATGRPDQVLAALHLSAGGTIERTCLILAEPDPPGPDTGTGAGAAATSSDRARA